MFESGLLRCCIVTFKQARNFGWGRILNVRFPAKAPAGVIQSAGTKLGPYEILAPIGAGGMGEVYRARDTKLDREVAIKVCPLHWLKIPSASLGSSAKLKFSLH